MLRLFSWTTREGQRIESDSPPDKDSDSVVELICQRTDEMACIRNVRRHEAIPEHEAAMQCLPQNLQILRLRGCRIRTFPDLPLGIKEVYADQNDFFSVPDLSKFTDLIVLELNDGRLETFDTALPATLARCNVDINALQRVRVPEKPRTLPYITAYCNPKMVVEAPDGLVVGQNLAERPRHMPLFGRQPATQCAAVVNIAEQEQSVHDTGVQNSTHSNINYIVNWGSEYPILSKEELLRSIKKGFCENSKRWWIFFKGSLSNTFFIQQLKMRLETPYSMNGIMIGQLVERLWCRIEHLPKDVRLTAIQRMKEEISESANLCSNGFMVRMANVLIGIDEHVVLRLETNQIMGTRVPLTMKKMLQKGGWTERDEPWEWYRDCFVETMKDLDDCDEHDAKRRRDWLHPFYEGFSDELTKQDHEEKEEEKEEEKDVDVIVEERFKELMIPTTETWAVQEALHTLQERKLIKKTNESAHTEHHPIHIVPT